MTVEQINELVQTTINYLNENTGTSARGWEPFLPFLGTIIGAFIALVLVCFASQRNKKEKRAAEIQQKLNCFYNPLLFLFKKDTAFFEVFNFEAKKEAESLGEEYRTLDFLILGKHKLSSFSQTDRQILDEILNINAQISDLIVKNMGYIDKDLAQPLVELSRHYELLRLAEQGKIKNVEEYKRYVYPVEIKEKVQNKVDELYEELKKLDV